MKYDSDLNPIPDTTNGGSDSRNSGLTITGTGTISGSGSGSTIPGSERNASGIAGSNEGMGSIEGDSDLLPFDVPFGNGKSARDNDPTRNGGSRRRGSRRNRADASDSGSDTGNASDRATGAEETAQHAGGPAPRSVKLEALSGKPTAKETLLNKKFFAEGYTLLFDAVGSAVRDRETWAIEKDGDALELADRTVDWLKTLDRTKSAKWEKALAKWQPFLMLLMALVMIVGPRIAQTSAKRKNAKHLPSNNAGNRPAGSAGANGAAASNGGTSGPIPHQAPIRPEPARSAESIRANERPLRREDFAELFGETLHG